MLTIHDNNFHSAAYALNNAISFVQSESTAQQFLVEPDSPVYFEMRRDLPYVISEAGTPNTYTFLNRQYAPLGLYAPTEEPPSPEHQFFLSHTQLVSITYPNTTNALYDDNNAPWLSRELAHAYLSRLLQLRTYF